MLNILAFIIAFISQAAVIVPFERDVPRVEEYSYLKSDNNDSPFYSTLYGVDANEQSYFQGFTIQNAGPNIVVPTTPRDVEYPHRDFLFVSDDHSKRETYLWVTDDNGSGKVSDLFETMLVFLPRNNQMQVTEKEEELLVTLTTGEEVAFDKNTFVIKSGVLSELPLDMNPDSTQRKHAQINYTGEGILLRSDASGADPRSVKDVLVYKKGLKACRIPASSVWTQGDFPQFKFVRDEDAFALIKRKCGKRYIRGLKIRRGR